MSPGLSEKGKYMSDNNLLLPIERILPKKHSDSQKNLASNKPIKK